MANNAIGVDLAYCNEVQPGGYDLMKKGGVSFAYIKITQGNRIYDDHFETNWAGTKAAGILRGVYHVYEPIATAQQQIDCIASHLPADAELPLVLDVEIDLQVSSAYLLNDVSNLLQLAESTFQRKPVIYTGRWWWEPNMTPAPAWAANYDYWLASYPFAPGKVNLTWEQLPSILPSGWADPVTSGRRPMIWQFSGDKFVLPGVNGALDLNLFDGDENTLRRWAGQPETESTAPGKTTPAGTTKDRLARLEAEARRHGWDI